MEHRFDLAIPADATLAQLTDELFLRQFATEVGVTVTAMAVDGGAASMDWQFSTQARGIPPMARALLPDRVSLRWAQEWEPLAADGSAGHLTVDVLTRPTARCVGSSLLSGRADASRITTTTRTRAALPRPLAARVEAMIDRELMGWILGVQARVLLRRHRS